MTKLFQIRPVAKNDKTWVTNLLKEWWSGPVMITRGKLHHVDRLPGFIATRAEERVGLVTYNNVDKECEITSMNSLSEGKGIGTALVEAVKEKAKTAGYERLWLITTNDNTKALRFWQKRGFNIAAIYPNAMEQVRKIKPEIPLTGDDGIPIRDEIELEMKL
jgi:N-acetylglutamate synthase-like GNAT family acetyltransferase